MDNAARCRIGDKEADSDCLAGSVTCLVVMTVGSRPRQIQDSFLSPIKQNGKKSQKSGGG